MLKHRDGGSAAVRQQNCSCGGSPGTSMPHSAGHVFWGENILRAAMSEHRLHCSSREKGMEQAKDKAQLLAAWWHVASPWDGVELLQGFHHLQRGGGFPKVPRESCY